MINEAGVERQRGRQINEQQRGKERESEKKEATTCSAHLVQEKRDKFKRTTDKRQLRSMRKKEMPRKKEKANARERVRASIMCMSALDKRAFAKQNGKPEAGTSTQTQRHTGSHTDRHPEQGKNGAPKRQGELCEMSKLFNYL